jgi:aldehyde:ferredoxin oxidoreductase
MHGWQGKILKIDLSTQTYRIERPQPQLYARYIGGKGLAGHFLQPEITRRWDDPGMPLLLFAGPLVGTTSPTSGRMTVMSKSPLTGTVGDASVGGSFGTQLKKAGWDGLMITGKSNSPCGIQISDETVEFTDATALAGMKISRIHRLLKSKGATAAIGTAAENGVRFAAVIFDGHYAAGRNGLGLLSGAKNLKYITVRGNGSVPVFDKRELAAAREDILRLAAASPVLMGNLGITHYGTAALYDLTSSRRMMPTANFRKTCFEAARQTNAHSFKLQYSPAKTGCRGCHILCKKKGQDGEVLPEFETANHFGPLLENSDIDVVRRANLICNDLGMDTISAGATLACHAEIEQVKLAGDQILSLLESIGTGKGPGRQLGQGAYRYAQSRGKPGASVTVKKLELPAYDPRGAYGMALGYAVSTRGGCHLRAYPIGSEILRKPVPTDRFSFSGKARIVKIAEDFNAVIDSLSACKFICFAASLEEYARAVSAVTGVETSGQELLQLGERIYYAERIMNARNGFRAPDDDLPPRFFRDSGSSGNGIHIRPIDRNAFLAARGNYYAIRGLGADGRPTVRKATELGLSWQD